MKLLSTTGVLSVIAFAWMAMTFWTFAEFFMVENCDPKSPTDKCISVNEIFNQPLQVI